jgi:CBS domain containing-hemolysin-like protein
MVVALSRRASAAELLGAALESGHHRFPVYGRNLDDVLGIASVREGRRPSPPVARGGEELTALLLAIGVVLLSANAIFVAAEFAFVAARKPRLQELAAQGDGGGRIALAAMRDLPKTLAATQLGITMASIGLALLEPFRSGWSSPLTHCSARWCPRTWRSLLQSGPRSG